MDLWDAFLENFAVSSPVCLVGNVTGSGESPDVGISTSNETSALTTRECNDGFYESSLGNTTVCHPECGEWEEFSHGTVVAVNAKP